MKKFLAIILALLMSLTLVACSSTTETQLSDDPSASPSEAAAKTDAPATPSITQANTGKTGNQPLDKVGFFDPDFDYASGTKYKVQYMVSVTGPLYDMFNSAFAFWAEKMNIEYGALWASGGDNDAFLNNLTTFINQGVDGFLLDPEETVLPRIVEITEEAGVEWMGCMSPPRNVEDAASPLIHPSVGFDHVWFGQQMALKLLDYKNTAWADVDMIDVGYISVDYSLSGVLHDREVGAEEVWDAQTNLPDNFFIADTTTTGPTMDGANTSVTAILSAETKYTHWLISAMFDDAAMGAASAIDAMGLTDNACIVTIGGTSLQRQWDTGQNDAWKFAMFTPQTIYGEPIIGALYAFMSGQATPETIWPSWVNASDHGTANDTYASLLLPSYWMDHDNYKQLLEWSDVYAGASEFDYDATGITRETFNARMDIPAAYAG